MVEAYGINTSHFLGQASHRGKKYPGRGRPLFEFLVKNGPSISSHDLRRRLLAEGFFQPRCTGCWRYAWNRQPIPLELEHKNGDRYDNRLENLELLCPYCHALTPTYRGRNIGRYDVGIA
jgi:hypothetical protein